MNSTKLNREDIVKAISGILIVLAFIAVISIFANIGGSTSNSSSGSNSGSSSGNNSSNGSGSENGGNSNIGDNGDNNESPVYTLSGTWVFNETVTLEGGEIYDQSVQFNSNNQTFYGMYTEKTATWGYQPSSTGGTQNLTFVYNRDGWIDQAYRTITFAGTQTVSQEFFEWFIANATRTSVDGKFEFTINGMEYFALEGMTWAEWVNSAYNTDGYVNEETHIEYNTRIVCVKDTEDYVTPYESITVNGSYECYHVVL